jgi:L-arabinokinase
MVLEMVLRLETGERVRGPGAPRVPAPEAAHGRSGHLLPVLCRPDVVGEPVALPTGLRVVGWPSGAKRGVSGHARARARVAALMGKRLLEAALGRKAAYLTDFSPEDYHMQQEHLPLAMPGEDYLDGWKVVDDPRSCIDPGETYPVRAATAFAIHEHDRAQRVLADLRQFAETGDEALLWRMGGCLYASHDGQGAMGLGSPEEARMVEALRALPPEAGVFGARMSGGVVAVLLRESALPRLQELAGWLTPGQELLK